ncbi:MAG: hypothetical protein PWP51_328 [Clostridiales bacterium]|jgi:hypothetical protein|nr:hypothetical protein [Clostridiales bacterium]MDN5297775.1 hypothetical protein [Clostridiales bacterium]
MIKLNFAFTQCNTSVDHGIYAISASKMRQPRQLNLDTFITCGYRH